MVKRFLAILGVAFLVFSSVVLPVAAEESSSASSDDAVLRALPDLPEDEYSKKLIFYDAGNDCFYLISSGCETIAFSSVSGGTVTPDAVYPSTGVLGGLTFYYNRGPYLNRTYKLDAVNGTAWESATPPGYATWWYGEGEYDISSYKLWDDSYKPWCRLIYANFECTSGDWTFFPSPSPIANTPTYFSIHTGLWQTVRGTVNKVIVVGILILLSMVLLLLLKRLTRLLMRGGIL